MAGFNDVWENRIIDHVSGKTALPAIQTSYMALLTALPAESATLATMAEASYTTYARKAVAPADIAAAASGQALNTVEQLFGACMAGSATVVAWAWVTAASGTSGDIIMFGAVTSTVISTTQTPPTVAVSALAFNLD